MKISSKLLFLIIFSSLVLAGCGGENGGKKVILTMREFGFDPANIEVEAGQEVTLNFSNLGALDHNFYLMKKDATVTEAWSDAYAVDAIIFVEDVSGGGNASITFTAPEEPGEYQFLCSVPAHLEQGMSGTLTVVAP